MQNSIQERRRERKNIRFFDHVIHPFIILQPLKCSLFFSFVPISHIRTRKLFNFNLRENIELETFDNFATYILLPRLLANRVNASCADVADMLNLIQKVFSLPTKLTQKKTTKLRFISFEVLQLAAIYSLLLSLRQSIVKKNLRNFEFVFQALITENNMQTFLFELYLSSNRSEPKYVQ